jgi:hypothetical protein
MTQPKNGKKIMLCINNAEYEDLEVGKVYRILPDPSATKAGFLRVIDESGEDYLYPASLFVPIELPQSAKRVLLAAMSA